MIMYATKIMDHAGYQRKMKTKSVAELKFIIKDCREALNAHPDNPNAGYYADEIHYASAELKKRGF